MARRRALLVLGFLNVADAACMEGGYDCIARDQETFDQVVGNAECDFLWLTTSDLATLDGLENSPNVKAVILSRNAQLADLGAATGSRNLQVEENADVAALDVRLEEFFSMSGTDVDSLRIQLTRTAVSPSEGTPASNGRVWLSRGHFGEVDLGCDRDCHPFVGLCDVNQDVVFRVGQEVTQIHLLVDFAVQTHEFLHPLGLPRSVIFSGDGQDLDVMRSYRAWLDGQGFAGSFEYCEDDADCVEVTAQVP